MSQIPSCPPSPSVIVSDCPPSSSPPQCFHSYYMSLEDEANFLSSISKRVSRSRDLVYGIEWQLSQEYTSLRFKESKLLDCQRKIRSLHSLDSVLDSLSDKVVSNYDKINEQRMKMVADYEKDRISFDCSIASHRRKIRKLELERKITLSFLEASSIRL